MTQKRILIVEDEAMTSMVEHQMLEILSYNVAGFTLSGESTIQRVNADQPDLVLMDIKLTGDIDGIEAARTIQESHQIPVLFVTAYGDKEKSKTWTTPSPRNLDYIVKPFTEEELGSEIGRLLGYETCQRACDAPS